MHDLLIFEMVPDMLGVIQEGKKSFKERLQGIQDVCLQVQEGMDSLASLGERVKKYVCISHLASPCDTPQELSFCEMEVFAIFKSTDHEV